MSESSRSRELLRRGASHAGLSHRGFTLTEILIVVALIAVLLSLLLPALGGIWSSGEMTKSMNNMRQIGAWMHHYSLDNKDYVLPSRFNYRENAYAGKVRSNPSPALGLPGSGTWADVLHAVFEVGSYPDAAVASLGNDYRFSAPDKPLYDLLDSSAISNPFRSAAPNTRNWNDRHGDEPCKPYGKGAQEEGEPGYFAANDFFRSGWVTGSGDQDRVITNGQIRYPDQSLYLVDSYIGEVIEDNARSFDSEDRNVDGKPDWDVDFRYGDSLALILFLDGHVDSTAPWLDLQDMARRKIRVCDLDKRSSRCE